MHCESYLLDSQALALMAHRGEDGSQSKIVTLHGIYTSKKTPVELLNLACVRNQTTKLRQKQAACEVLKFKHKPPFILSDGVGVFPTSSSKHDTCCWIFNHFFTTREIDKKKTELTFPTDVKVTVAASLHIIHQQNGRLHSLLSHYAQTKKELHFEQYLFNGERINR
ncbi:competence protein ComK [Sporosarcina gallistercoris]|uniref:Competence protein ComK n=1 Tax=Sporosarcina gallistercoris TaxID=2762245 RepID=A0ABR8PMI6_9BACL|nr:competence protein ComK [Sporosarcina gallistercoris]MBD7909383.1 competence protein ComK [Sporosarcina gallistercoris]